MIQVTQTDDLIQINNVYKTMFDTLLRSSENTNKFYSGVPVDLEEESLLHLIQYNHSTSSWKYNVTTKLDGVRFLLCIHPSLNSVVFINRIPSFFVPVLIGTNVVYSQNYLLKGMFDGEYYQDTHTFFVFDILYYENEHVCVLPFTERQQRLDVFFSSKRIEREYLDVLHEHTGIQIKKKPYIDLSSLSDMDDIQQYVENDFTARFGREYRFDGLVFTPTDTKYILFDSWKYPQNIMYKWKPRHEHTIDFKFEQTLEKESTNGIPLIYSQNRHDPFVVKNHHDNIAENVHITLVAKQRVEKGQVFECDIDNQYIVFSIVPMFENARQSRVLGDLVLKKETFVLFYIKETVLKESYTNTPQVSTKAGDNVYTDFRPTDIEVRVYNITENDVPAESVCKCVLVHHTDSLLYYCIQKVQDRETTQAYAFFKAQSETEKMKKSSCTVNIRVYTDINPQDTLPVLNEDGSPLAMKNEDGTVYVRLTNQTGQLVQQNTTCKCVKLYQGIDIHTRRLREDKQKANTPRAAHTILRLHRLNIDINTILPYLRNPTNMNTLYSVLTAEENIPFPKWQMQSLYLQTIKYLFVPNTESIIMRYNRQKNKNTEFEIRIGHYGTNTRSGVTSSHFEWLMKTLETYQFLYTYSASIDINDNDHVRTSYYIQNTATEKEFTDVFVKPKINVYKSIKKIQHDVKNYSSVYTSLSSQKKQSLEDLFGYSFRISVATEQPAVSTSIQQGKTYDMHLKEAKTNKQSVRYKERHSFVFFPNWCIDLTHVVISKDEQQNEKRYEVEIEFKPTSTQNEINIDEMNTVLVFVLMNLYGKSRLI